MSLLFAFIMALDYCLNKQVDLAKKRRQSDDKF